MGCGNKLYFQSRGFDSRPACNRFSIWMADVRLGARSILGKIANRFAREARNEIRPSKFTFPAEPERCAVAFEEHPRRR